MRTFFLVTLISGVALGAESEVASEAKGIEKWGGMDFSASLLQVSRHLRYETINPQGAAPGTPNPLEVADNASNAAEVKLKFAMLGIETALGGLTGAEGWAALSYSLAETSSSYENNVLPGFAVPPSMLREGGIGVELGGSFPWTLAHGDSWLLAAGLGLSMQFGEPAVPRDFLLVQLAIRGYARPWGIPVRLEYDGDVLSAFQGRADHRARLYVLDLWGFRVGGQLVHTESSSSVMSGPTEQRNAESATALGLTLAWAT